MQTRAIEPNNKSQCIHRSRLRACPLVFAFRWFTPVLLSSVSIVFSRSETMTTIQAFVEA